MRIDVFATPVGLPPAIQETAAVMIDVFRASTTITTALASGARCVLPVTDVEQAVRLIEPYRSDEAVLGGERDSLRIDGFALGNSPAEYSRDAVAGRVVVFTTTNGTAALAAIAGARRVLVGCFLNLAAVAAALAGEPDITIVCAGNAGRFSLEDFACAGALVARLAPRTTQMGDGALAARAVWRSLGRSLNQNLLATEHARRLSRLGFAADLELALRIDSIPVVPQLAEGRIIL
uniref:Probable 2-phosphosulfolactate phosphatase n=1 Tax=candidate division WOR-3 bacterium TaxID=2052148 RepID=A0A7C4CBM2_UNCW3